jgi:hypothetical protein
VSLRVPVREDGVGVGIDGDETGRPGRVLVRLLHQPHALRLQPTLQPAYIGEGGGLLRVAVPPRVERQDVLLEHPLEQPDEVVAVLQNQPVAGLAAAEDGEPALLAGRA